jgi:hypothetical protein
VLFQHPNAPLLIVCQPQQRTVQSLPLALIHQAPIKGQLTTFNPKRTFTPEEQAELEANRLWGDEVGPGQIGNYASESWEPAPALLIGHSPMGDTPSSRLGGGPFSTQKMSMDFGDRTLGIDFVIHGLNQ